MKPRLPSACWTEEDIDIWERAELRQGVHRARRMIEKGVDSDRRDADLMLLLMQTRGQWIEEAEWKRMLADRGLTWTHQVLL